MTAALGPANDAAMTIEPNTLAAAERDAGFRLLFDGRSTAGWRTYNSDSVDPGWRAVDGTLRFHPAPDPEYGHDLISVETFASFELRIDWMLWQGGNSGLFFHIREAPGRPPYESGPEFQLLDNDAHPDARNGPERLTGACYGLYAPRVHAARPVGEWNEAAITVDGDHVRHVLNGQLVADYTLGSPDWTDRVARSKFRDWPAFAAERVGHLMLQDHRDPVAFRNIRVRPIG